MTLNLEGGMIDDGNTIEPSTGNPIPPGSLDQEVKDDIDAKLSEGEYVLPADVVQFYGLDKIEKMVTKAKTSLEEMDRNGRIGGQAPEEDQLPFTDEELASIDVEDTEGQGYAEGGVVTPIQQSIGMTSREYIGPDGSKRTFLFMNGTPVQFIPDGWIPATAQTEKQQETIQDNYRDDSDESHYEEKERKSIDDWVVDDFENYSKNEGLKSGIGKAATVLNPLVGLGVNLATNYTDKKVKEALEGILEGDEVADKDRYQSVYDKLYSEDQDDKEQGGIGGIVDSIKTGLFGEDGIPFNEGIWNQGGSKANTTQSSNPTVTLGTKDDANEDSVGNPATNVTSSPTPKPRPEIKDIIDTQGEKEAIEQGYATPFYEGGFVTKRKKKAK